MGEPVLKYFSDSLEEKKSGILVSKTPWIEELLILIKKFEGLRLKAYYCPAGILTCGYGSTGADIKKDTIWTKEYAEKRATSDALYALNKTKKLCPNLFGFQLQAIADFTYNLGSGRLAGSTLRRKINSGDFNAVDIELRKWVRGGGKILPGLVLRRETEIALFHRR